MGLHIINFLECIQLCVMCMHIEIASIIFEMCIVPEPATTSGTGLLLDRDTGVATTTGRPGRRYYLRHPDESIDGDEKDGRNGDDQNGHVEETRGRPVVTQARIQ